MGTPYGTVIDRIVAIAFRLTDCCWAQAEYLTHLAERESPLPFGLLTAAGS